MQLAGQFVATAGVGNYLYSLRQARVSGFDGLPKPGFKKMSVGLPTMLSMSQNQDTSNLKANFSCSFTKQK